MPIQWNAYLLPVLHMIGSNAENYHAGGLRRIFHRYLGDPIKCNHVAGFILFVAAAILIFGE